MDDFKEMQELEIEDKPETIELNPLILLASDHITFELPPNFREGERNFYFKFSSLKEYLMLRTFRDDVYLHNATVKAYRTDNQLVITWKRQGEWLMKYATLSIPSEYEEQDIDNLIKFLNMLNKEIDAYGNRPSETTDEWIEWNKRLLRFGHPFYLDYYREYKEVVLGSSDIRCIYDIYRREKIQDYPTPITIPEPLMKDMVYFLEELMEDLELKTAERTLPDTDPLPEVLSSVCKALLENEDLLIIDLETTGLKADLNEIIEIYALHVRGGEVVNTFNALIKPKEPVPERITKLTGITNEMLQDQGTAEEVFKVFDEFLQQVKPSVVVGHNIKFDLEFLHRAYEKHLNKPFYDIPAFCTMMSAYVCLGYFKYPRLGELAYKFNVEHKSFHRAYDDALCVFKILKALSTREPDIPLNQPHL